MSRVRRATQLDADVDTEVRTITPCPAPATHIRCVLLSVFYCPTYEGGRTIGEAEDRERGKQSKQNDFCFFRFYNRNDIRTHLLYMHVKCLSL